MLGQSSETPLVACIVLISIKVRDIFIVLLVNRVISQMSKFILFACLSLIRFTGESSKSFMVDINSPRIDTGNQNVDS